MNIAQMLGLSTQGGGVPTSSVADLREINEALQQNAMAVMKAESVGIPLQGQAYTGPSGGAGGIAPLVPQSIQGTLDSSTFDAQHIRFWKMLSRVNVTSTLHESVRVNEHGSMALDPWIAEGEVGPLSEAQYERLVVEIKFMAEHIELTDVATMVGIIGNQRDALAQRTQNGTMSLLGKLERNLFNADSAMTPLAFDGLYKQLTTKAPNNVTDAKGSVVTPQDLQETMSKLAADPNFGAPTVILCHPDQHQAIVNIATSHGRHDQVKIVNEGNQVNWGHKQVFVGGHMGNIEVVPCPLIRPDDIANVSAQGDNPPPALSGFSPAVSNLGATSGSKFYAADAGAYRYKVVGVGDGGTTAPVSLGPITLAAGEAARITIPDTRATGDSTLRYYRVFRSPVDGAAGTERFMGTYAVNNGGAPDSHLDDLNLRRPRTCPFYILQLTPDVMYWAQLLDFMRRPLAQVKTTIPFLLMLFGALNVKVATKNWVIDNAALNL